jgi:hypothetical protein
MPRILPFVLGLFLAANLCAQEAPSGDSIPPQPHRYEVGLNITNTLVRFFGTQATGRADDPYLLTLRIGNDRRRTRIGLNFAVVDRVDPDFLTFDTRQRSTDVDLRVGHEWVYSWARRFALYWGADVVGEFRLEEVRTFSPGTGNLGRLRTQVWGIGAGPVIGVLWKVHPRVTLSTESTVYAIYRSGVEEVDVPPAQERTTFHDFGWRPILPSSLYVNFAF